MSSLKAYLAEDLRILKSVLIRAAYILICFVFLVMSASAFKSGADLPLIINSAVAAFFFWLFVRE